MSNKEAVSVKSGKKPKVCTGSVQCLTFHGESFPWSGNTHTHPPTPNVDDLQAVKEQSVMKKKVAFCAHLQ